MLETDNFALLTSTASDLARILKNPKIGSILNKWQRAGGTVVKPDRKLNFKIGETNVHKVNTANLI